MANEPPLYDEIGRTYTRTRREDPGFAAALHAPLGNARTVVNVGAGTGSYEPADRAVVAVEPSPAMLGQREGRTRRVVRGVAEALPFPDGTFDAAMAVLTVHHWSDPAAGLRELRRVARRQVVLFYEPLQSHGLWVLDYFPEALDLPTEQDPPGEELLRRILDVQDVLPVLVSHDCLDGVGAAFWARPEAYTDPDVQAGMSWLAQLPADARRRGTERLAADLASGAWDERLGHLRHQDTYDGGYRIAVAGRPPAGA
jgi:SAM-dependent methyltransferase